MPAGLQVFDKNGNLVADITTRLTKVLGMVYVNAGSSGSVSSGEITTNNGWFSFFPDADYSTIKGIISPLFSVNNGSISWSYPETGNDTNQQCSGYLEYGVY